MLAVVNCKSKLFQRTIKPTSSHYSNLGQNVPNWFPLHGSGSISPVAAYCSEQPGVLSGITMVFVPAVSTFAISRLLGGGTQMMLGDLIELQFFGGAYNPQLGAAIALVMMAIVVVCMLVMNRFGDGEEQAVML